MSTSELMKYTSATLTISMETYSEIGIMTWVACITITSREVTRPTLLRLLATKLFLQVPCLFWENVLEN